MSDKYRNKLLSEETEQIIGLLTAIECRKIPNLGVMAILKDYQNGRPDMLMEEALEIAIREAARKANFKTIVLTTAFDRVLEMLEQMFADIEPEAMKDANVHDKLARYKKRLVLLTNFKAIAKELTPAKHHDEHYIPVGSRV